LSKNVALFVDVANLYYSARGQDVDVDYVALLKTATKGRDLIRAYAYSGLDPENENQRKFIDFLNKNGYKVLTKDIRKFGDGRVKANLDIELVVDLFRLADRMDIAVIVSGDGDFAPAIKALQDKGVRCEVISFRPNTSSDLIAVADEFIDIMKIAGIGRGSKEARAQRGMSAPEMPAKEVVPEFGFREASPHVAQAALAALREGRPEPATGGNGSGRGRGRGRAAAASAATEPVPSEAVVDETAVTTLDEGVSTIEGEARKRRRRRGGRGRGRRGRSGAEVEAPSEAAPIADTGEIGWVELDDLSQLSELEGVEDLAADREFSFEEADEATLAELGLSPEAVAGTATPADAGTAAEPVEEKKPVRRRSTRRPLQPPEADAAAATEADAPASEKKPARRRTTRKAAEAVEPGAEAATTAASPSEAGPKAKRTRSRSTAGTTARSRKAADAGDADRADASASPARRRTTKKEPAESPAAGEDTEGIWQRFRSARGRGSGSA
jgi:uncharacterized LabA/DUF88 family protein